MDSLERIRKGEGLPPIKDLLEDFNQQPLVLQPNEKSFEYYKGFYDATHQFMQTFEKLIEAGAFSGTKFNSNN